MQLPKNPLKNTTNTHTNKKPKHQHPTYNPPKPEPPTTTTSTNISFKPNTDVKGLKFGGQFIVKSFTVRRSRPQELSNLLNLPTPPPQQQQQPQQPQQQQQQQQILPSTITFIPSNFTILAHHAWHTLTLGLGTKKSKIIIFMFDTIASKSAVELSWPHEIPLGDVNKKLIRKGLMGWDLARFKFRKGCITFYVFAVKKNGVRGFQCGEDLRLILHSVVALKDFLDHTAMLALPNQRPINHSSHSNHPVTVAAH